MATLQSTEPIGTTARLAGARLGATRLGAAPRSSQLKPGTALYAWTRSDGTGGEVNRGQPPVVGLGGWTTLRS